MNKIIKYQHLDFLQDILKNCNDFINANFILKDLSGIIDFFNNQESYSRFLKQVNNIPSKVSEADRREYGDFQTPDDLTDKICSFLFNNNFNPQVITEPTFGKGSFIISALKHFQSVKYIFGIEIYILDPKNWASV